MEKTVTCGELIDKIKNEAWDEGWKEGWEKETLSILNSLVNDSRCGFTVEELSDKFGVPVNRILAGK